MRSCSIYTRRLLSGVTRFYHGQVSCHACSSFVRRAEGIADPNDAFWLAQTHFLTGHYLRAERLLTEPLPTLPKRPLPRRDSTDTEVDSIGRRSKGKGRLEDEVNGLSHHEVDPQKRGRLVDESLACRYLAAQCFVSSLLCKQVRAELMPKGTTGRISQSIVIARGVQPFQGS